MLSLAATEPPEFVRLAAHPLRWQLLGALATSDLRVRELTALVDEPQSLVSYHLRLLRAGGLVVAARSSHDGRDTYYHLDLDRCGDAVAAAGAALHPSLAPAVPAPPLPRRPRGRRTSVLFVCTGNSARSPIAEALLRRHAEGRLVVASAGTRPKDALHPSAVRVLRDHYGLDVSGQRPQHVDALARRRFDHVVTLCDRAREVCAEHVDASSRIHWSVPDPSAGRDAAFRRTATDIETRVRHLLPILGGSDRKEVRP
jgi:ArsR family transcriptional regulator, arsenate/arsenite/antimonite-responsive transcriptional repressor / arsenate reductase (thioredoxin)